MAPAGCSRLPCTAGGRVGAPCFVPLRHRTARHRPLMRDRRPQAAGGMRWHQGIHDEAKEPPEEIDAGDGISAGLSCGAFPHFLVSARRTRLAFVTPPCGWL